jgi:hypothetical protein
MIMLMQTWKILIKVVWRRILHRDGADRRLHRIGGGDCQREIKVSSESESIQNTTFSIASFQVDLRPP